VEDVVLRVEGLVKKYNNKEKIHGIDLSVRRGEVVVVLGPSGCGKSTLLRCINLLEPVHGGHIYIGEDEITAKGANLPLLRQKLGMVFQSYDLFAHLTVMGNILLAPMKVQKRKKEEVMAEAQVWLERVGLGKKANKYPRELSGGEKQRVAIVRTLVMHPEVLLLDEITAALDPEKVHEVLNVVLDLSRDGKTMVIVTHEMRFARAIADRIVFMDHGNIVEEADPETFFTNPKTERAKQFLESFEYSNVKNPPTENEQETDDENP